MRVISYMCVFRQLQLIIDDQRAERAALWVGAGWDLSVLWRSFTNQECGLYAPQYMPEKIVVLNA